jgi:hypothetical protein
MKVNQNSMLDRLNESNPFLRTESLNNAYALTDLLSIILSSVKPYFIDSNWPIDRKLILKYRNLTKNSV